MAYDLPLSNARCRPGRGSSSGVTIVHIAVTTEPRELGPSLSPTAAMVLVRESTRVVLQRRNSVTKRLFLSLAKGR